MERAASRNFTVEYFEESEVSWVISTQLKDDQHDIEMTVAVNTDEMIIKDARIKFNRYPIEHCQLIEAKADQLVGLKIDPEFIRNSMKIFMGPKGCPNIMSLLNVSLPGMMYFYYPYQIKRGKMDSEQFNSMVRNELKNACLAHTML